jgi:PIN domain nuclease of toxin-antitoxin system
MKLLLDTHILLWSANDDVRLTGAAKALLENDSNMLHFSTVSLWEIVIKHSLKRSDFEVNPRTLVRRLLEYGYQELKITHDHALAVLELEPIHKDPFDRLLIVQAASEGITLLTADTTVAKYRGLIQLI